MARMRWLKQVLALSVVTMATVAQAADVELTPTTTKIQFVGTHLGEKPDPRTGHFAKFTGKANVEGTDLKSLTVEIDTKSLTTEIDRLTGHLKSPDFFDVNQYPKAKFESKSITKDAEGKTTITGDLTLRGVTKSISFPATVSTDGGLKLKSEFKLDRTQFGMTFGPDRVHKEVAMTVSVGS